MVHIQPINLWIGGTTVTANIFQLRIIIDNLKDFAQLYYQLGNETINPDDEFPIITWYQDGNLSITGQDYTNWNNDPDANAWIYSWAATQLNIVII